MLVLTRTESEVICIGDNIQIKVLHVKGGKVKIGINAPIELPVHRQEVYLLLNSETENTIPEY